MTSGQWGGWSKPMENYNLSKWGIQNHELDKYSDQTSKILEIDNIFRKSNINKYFNQIEFQYSKDKMRLYVRKNPTLIRTIFIKFIDFLNTYLYSIKFVFRN